MDSLSRGESSCVDPANFNEGVGQEIAYTNAFDKIWQLEGYLLMEGLHLEKVTPKGFGWALQQLELGKKVAREGWNGRGMWLSLSCPNTQKVKAESFWSENNAAYAATQGGTAKVLPCITMKTATGEILMGWLASQTDMLAKDWVTVD